METIKFSDFMNGNYSEVSVEDKRSFSETLKTILLAMLIVYFAPQVMHVIYNIFIGIGGM